MDIKSKISDIRSSLPDEVTLVAVSKFQSVETIKTAYDAGQRVFGESRVQELTAKQPSLPEDIKWHFIGSLQTNKIKYIAPYISMIQSVDSLKLIKEIDRQAKNYYRKIDILIEVYIAEEDSKHGFTPDECKALFTDFALSNFTSIQVRGLMGMATFTNDVKQLKREFGVLKDLYDEIRLLPAIDRSIFTELSMGMSGDYKTAVEQGSTMVRIGTAIFGERGY